MLSDDARVKDELWYRADREFRDATFGPGVHVSTHGPSGQAILPILMFSGMLLAILVVWGAVSPP